MSGCQGVRSEGEDAVNRQEPRLSVFCPILSEIRMIAGLHKSLEFDEQGLCSTH